MHNRIKTIKKHINSFKSSNELREEILKALDETHDFPEIGKYYTFLHIPDKKITYDQHPLVATMNLEKWGFNGFNFNSKNFSNYNWNSVKSKYHLIRKNELNDLIEMKFGKLRLNR